MGRSDWKLQVNLRAGYLDKSSENNRELLLPTGLTLQSNSNKNAQDRDGSTDDEMLFPIGINPK